MLSSAVIPWTKVRNGCLTTASGPVRTIPWSAVNVAGMSGKNELDLQIEGVTEQLTAYAATHDPLWILYGDGFAQIMIEKDSPKRDAILSAFAQQLGPRWEADRLDPQALMRMLFRTASRPARTSRRLIFMFAIIGFVVLSVVVMLVIGRSR
jgi:hypothetical protein